MLRRFTIALLAVLFMLPIGELSAQPGQLGDVLRLRSELERNRSLIERAREQVEARQDPIAARLLETAGQLLQQAFDAFDERTPEGYEVARRLGEQSRRTTLDVLARLRDSESSDEKVLARLEQVEERLRQVREFMPPNPGRGVESLYTTARRALDRAWEFYRAGNYRPALKLAEQVDRTIRRLTGPGGPGGRRAIGQFDERRNGVGDLIAQARLAVADCESPNAERLLAEAERRLIVADELHGARRYLLALGALADARNAASRAIRDCAGEDNLQRRYDELSQELTRLEERLGEVTGTAADGARKLADQAGEQLRRAADELASGRVDEATISLRAAQLALRQANELLRGAP